MKKSKVMETWERKVTGSTHSESNAARGSEAKAANRNGFAWSLGN